MLVVRNTKKGTVVIQGPVLPDVPRIVALEASC